MLRIKNISKEYVTGDLRQTALDRVSLNLRDSEFVAILGPSGSGKTTLLNIIGGLDRYDSGDLVIDGISTKKYRERDWDSYRNHTIGFVFQSYNLIPHQSILANVEIALTISGISGSERKQRAKQALEKVGLGQHLHKRPNQLSGGQMQRVAIARALVNDPKILLADEPTGALDSDTSLQVMDLLKEVAEDRLVVMVTHNPELAQAYATRIVTLKDGSITSDSNPCAVQEAEAEYKNMGKASMSLLTSLSLSFNNLWSKKARTTLVSLAGSIGIIGIALIMAISNGANQYIRSIEEDSLQEYPLRITESSFNLSTMYTAGKEAAQLSNNTESDTVKEWSVLNNLFSGVSSNDLKSLKAYFESDACDMEDYVQNIEYSYGITPYVFMTDDDGCRQINPDTSFSSLGITGSGSSSLMASFSGMSSDTFFALPEKQELFSKNYDLKAGKWPENYHECLLALTANGSVADLTLYQLGLRDPKELDKMLEAFAAGSSVKVGESARTYSYDEFLGIAFKVLPSADFYTYDKEYEVWTDRSSDQKYMQEQMQHAEELKIVGIAQPNSSSGTTSASENIGIAYHAALPRRLIEMAGESDIVRQQLAHPETNVITGKSFDDENDKSADVDLSKLFSVDKAAIQDIFRLDGLSGEGLDLSGIDLSKLDFSHIDIDAGSVLSDDAMFSMMPKLDENTVKQLLGGIRINMTESVLTDLFRDIISGYQTYAAGDKRTDISSMVSSLLQYLDTDVARALIADHVRQIIEAHSGEMITVEDLKAIVGECIAGYSLWLKAHSFAPSDFSHIDEYVRSDEAQQVLRDSVEALRAKIGYVQPDDKEINALLTDLAAGYETYADEKKLPSAAYILKSFQSYLDTDEAQRMIGDTISKSVDMSGLQKSISVYSDMISAQMASVMQTLVASVGTQVTAMLEQSMGNLVSGLSENLMSGFDFNTDELADMFQTNMSVEELNDLMKSLFSTEKTTYESNLRKLNYADFADPSGITIYPTGYEGKQHVKDIISDYNRRMEEAGEDDKVIEYTDIVDALMSSVTTIIDVISYILIAFVAVSLIVSSVMIGIITYISVLERTKEIGILRAIGASKRNIAQVFNAETFIIGLFSGVLGIGITLLLMMPGNAILHLVTNMDNVSAVLPVGNALILILLSVVLTLLGGLIPSGKAARKDPVTALRSE